MVDINQMDLVMRDMVEVAVVDQIMVAMVNMEEEVEHLMILEMAEHGEEVVVEEMVVEMVVYMVVVEVVQIML